MFEDAFGLKRQTIRTAVNKSLEQGIVTEDLAKKFVYKTSDVGDGWLPTGNIRL
jgi:3-isopropylmalate dehydrogenase